MDENKNVSKGQMSRGKALQAIGAMAAGVPFIKRAIDDLSMPGIWSDQDRRLNDPVLARAINELEYLTPADKFIVQRRGTPVLTEIPAEKLPAIGLTRETWKMEIIPDPESNSELGNPLTKERGTAIDWERTDEGGGEKSGSLSACAFMYKCSETIWHGIMGRGASTRFILDGGTEAKHPPDFLLWLPQRRPETGF